MCFIWKSRGIGHQSKVIVINSPRKSTISYNIHVPITICVQSVLYTCNVSSWNQEALGLKVIVVNPLTPKSDKNLISPYMITSESHIQVTGIKEMIIKLLIVKHILQCLRKCTENSIENMHTDGLRK